MRLISDLSCPVIRAQVTLGANSWNHVAQTSSASTYKRMAARLRQLMLDREIRVPIGREDVAAIVDAISASPGNEQQPQKKPPVKPLHFYVESDVDEDDPLRISARDLANECYKISKQVAAGDVSDDVMTFYGEDRRALHESIHVLRGFALGHEELTNPDLWRLFAEVQAQTSELLRVVLRVRDYPIGGYSSAARDFRLNLRARQFG